MVENVHYSFLLEYCRLEQSPRISPLTRLRNFTRQSGPDDKSSIPKPMFLKKENKHGRVYCLIYLEQRIHNGKTRTEPEPRKHEADDSIKSLVLQE